MACLLQEGLFCLVCLFRGHTGQRSGVPHGSALRSVSWQAQRTTGDIGFSTAVCLGSLQTRQAPLDHFRSVRRLISKEKAEGGGGAE